MFKHKSTSFHESCFNSQLRPSRPDSTVTKKRNSEILQNPPEILAKLYQVNRCLENNIQRLNEAELQIQERDHEILELKHTIKHLNQQVQEEKNQIHSYIGQNKALKQEIRKLENLPKIQKYNEQLFQDYQTVLIQNQNYQQQIIELQDQLNCISHRLRESEQAILLIKQTEAKVGYIEHDLDRIEEYQKRSLPELNCQLQRQKIANETAYQLINCGVDYLNAQFSRSISTITKQLQMLQKYSKSNVIMLNGQLSFNGFQHLMLETNESKVQQLMKKLNLGDQIQSWLEGILTFLMINCREIIQKEAERQFDALERKLQHLQKLVIQCGTAYDFSKFRRFSQHSKCDQTSYSGFSKKLNKENDDSQLSLDAFDSVVNKLNDQQMRLEQLFNDLQVFAETQSNKLAKEFSTNLRVALQNHEALQHLLKRELYSMKNSQPKQLRSSFMPKIL